MASDNITTFLKDIGAVVPENFTPTIDDVLTLVTDDITHSELVGNTKNLNITYPKKSATSKISASDTGDSICEQPGEFPLHRRKMND